MSSSTSEPRMSLLGLQLGEIILINSGGFVWRESEHPDRTTMSDRDRRLEGATGLKISQPADVYALAKFLGEVLRAMSLPFALRFKDVFDEGCNPMVEARDIFYALRALDTFRARPESERSDKDEPEIPETPWDPNTYYEARFQVIPAPEK